MKKRVIIIILCFVLISVPIGCQVAPQHQGKATGAAVGAAVGGIVGRSTKGAVIGGVEALLLAVSSDTISMIEKRRGRKQPRHTTTVHRRGLC